MKRNILILILLSVLILSFDKVVAATDSNSGTDTIRWINTVLLALGLVLLGWYQKYQIGILKREIESQKDMLSNLKQYSEIIDINKIKEYVQISEASIHIKKDIEFSEVQSQLSDKIKYIESEKEKLSLTITQTSDEIDKLKLDYMTLEKNSLERAVFFSNYNQLVTMALLISAMQERIIIYAEGLFTLNNIKKDKLDNFSVELSTISKKIERPLVSFDNINLSEIEQELELSEFFSKFDITEDVTKIKAIGKLISDEISQIIVEAEKKRITGIV